jgi:hypothetical protein
MIRYAVSDTNIEAEITLDIKAADERNEIIINGLGSEELADWLYYQHGRFGHLITDVTSAIDLSSALSKQTEYKFDLVQGADILRSYIDTTSINLIT